MFFVGINKSLPTITCPLFSVKSPDNEKSPPTVIVRFTSVEKLPIEYVKLPRADRFNDPQKLRFALPETVKFPVTANEAFPPLICPLVQFKLPLCVITCPLLMVTLSPETGIPLGFQTVGSLHKPVLVLVNEAPKQMFVKSINKPKRTNFNTPPFKTIP